MVSRGRLGRRYTRAQGGAIDAVAPQSNRRFSYPRLAAEAPGRCVSPNGAPKWCACLAIAPIPFYLRCYQTERTS